MRWVKSKTASKYASVAKEVPHGECQRRNASLIGQIYLAKLPWALSLLFLFAARGKRPRPGGVQAIWAAERASPSGRTIRLDPLN